MKPAINHQPIKTMQYSHDTGEYDNHRLNELIRTRSYEIFESRGAEPGHALDDWLHAESEIKHHLGFESPSRKHSRDPSSIRDRTLPPPISLLALR